MSVDWGYGAIISTRHVDGFVISDPKNMLLWIKHAENLAKFEYQSKGIEPTEKEIFQGLQVALVQAMQQEHDPHMKSHAGIFASAISKHSGVRYWVVDILEQNETSTKTRFIELQAASEHDARKQIEALYVRRSR